MNSLIKKHLNRQQPVELDITSFLNLMVILVPFLLITAVFTNLSVLQINLPTQGQQSQADRQKFEVQVVIETARLLVTDQNGTIISEVALQADNYDYAKLNRVLQQLKERYPEKSNVTILSQAKTSYDTLIQVMDASRTFQAIQDGQPVQFDLFPDISIGDAYKP